jgi:hypothetical protein
VVYFPYPLDDRLLFWALPEPTREDLDSHAVKLCDEVVKLLRRLGYWSDSDDGHDRNDNEDPVDPLLGQLARAPMTGTLAIGPAGSRVVTLGNPQDVRVSNGRAGHASGFNLEAAVPVAADDRLHRERLCRYLLRPPLAQGRLTERPDGRYAF